MKKALLPLILLILLTLSAHAAAETDYMTLTADTQVDLTLTEDLYVDLNGHNMTGTVVTNGYKVYGMDSTTDAYTNTSVGCFRCTDENGKAIVPVSNFKSDITGSVKRYMAIGSTEGYSFHRFYLGVTHQTLRPSTEGVGYKAMICGDDAVLAQIQAYGYTLQLGKYLPITVETSAQGLVSGQQITLRIDHFQVEDFGETNLSVSLSLRLKDGTSIQSSQCVMTLRSLMEALDQRYSSMATETIQAVLAFVEAHPILLQWNIPNLLAHVSDPTVAPDGMTYEKYKDLSPAEQQAYMMDFIEQYGVDAFFQWYSSAKDKYDKEHPPTEIPEDGNIDLNKP